MPHPCVVCGRSRMNPNNRTEEYIFFGFPVNDEPRCKKWLEFCCREELYKLTKKQLLQRMVCSKHFSLTDFVNDFYDRLNSTAVPKIYDPKQSLYNISCVLCGRFRKDPPDPESDGATFHHFPGEEFRCLEWLDFVGVDSYYRLTRKEIMFCYICSKHFDKNQFVVGYHNRLIDSAVPNIRYPNENENKKTIFEHGLINEVELFNSCNKNDKKIDPLPTTVLEGQACAACGRLRTDPKNKTQKYKFHPFPAYEIGRCLKWCQFLEREDILKMSPNQIRRLVLCSGHFQSGQNFNNGSGPCDAIPTIYDCDNNVHIITKVEDTKEIERENSKILRPAVSSKKPKMDPLSKPTPLAKKRGKSKRSTLINIPKIDPKIENCSVKKLPIPTANNWKLIANQFQPITLSNNVISNVTSDIKKVILPISTDISNLGAPIPVNSLSSIPPGLLIKINLPEQDKNSVKLEKKRTRKKVVQQTEVDSMQLVKEHSEKNKLVQSNIIVNILDNNLPEFIDCTGVSSEHMIDDNLHVKGESSFVKKFEEIDSGTGTDDREAYFENIEEEMIVEERQPKFKMSARCRKSLMPIKSELRRFLNKLKPHVRRLPKKSQAQVKLAIVNMVIDRL